MSKTPKQSKHSKCKFCGKPVEGKWQFCDNACVMKATKRYNAEYEALRKIKENLRLRREIFIAEVMAEGEPIKMLENPIV